MWLCFFWQSNCLSLTGLVAQLAECSPRADLCVFKRVVWILSSRPADSTNPYITIQFCIIMADIFAWIISISIFFNRRETFLVSNKKSQDFPDANENFQQSSLPLERVSSIGDNSLIYRFSVGQLPSWAKPKVWTSFTCHSCDKLLLARLLAACPHRWIDHFIGIINYLMADGGRIQEINFHWRGCQIPMSLP